MSVDNKKNSKKSNKVIIDYINDSMWLQIKIWLKAWNISFNFRYIYF